MKIPSKNVTVNAYDTQTKMISSTYGTAELQGDASPSPPKSYRLSKVAKIALALIACGAAAVLAAPGTRPAQGRSLERANQYRCPKGPEVSVLVQVNLNGKQRRLRPYRVECTGSLPTSEVKRRRARLVLGWGTAREDLRVLPAFPQGPQGML